jgi:hypothetical protein
LSSMSRVLHSLSSMSGVLHCLSSMSRSFSLSLYIASLIVDSLFLPLLIRAPKRVLLSHDTVCLYTPIGK